MNAQFDIIIKEGIALLSQYHQARAYTQAVRDELITEYQQPLKSKE